MSNNSALSSLESLERQNIEIENLRVDLHNKLIQKILELKSKLSNNASLTKLWDKLHDLEIGLYGGMDPEEIAVEIDKIEVTIDKYFRGLLYKIRHPVEIIKLSIAKTKNLFNRSEIQSKVSKIEIKK
jgi:hypothetical protein